jgi:hypothetical protein
MDYVQYKNLYSHGHVSPDIWGRHYWFMFHLGSYNYPLCASSIVSQQMKQFILGIPYMLPCEECRSHALLYINNLYDELDTITSGRDALFKFFVDFHNAVNKRLNKSQYSYEEVYKMYSY